MEPLESVGPRPRQARCIRKKRSVATRTTERYRSPGAPSTRMTPSVFTCWEKVGRTAVIQRKQQPVTLRCPLRAQNIPF